ncbi:unnamed protein product, partial [Durusdinium trenchii]
QYKNPECYDAWVGSLVKAAQENPGQDWAHTVQNLSSISPYQPKETKQESINAFLVARNSASASGLKHSLQEQSNTNPWQKHNTNTPQGHGVHQRQNIDQQQPIQQP